MKARPFGVGACAAAGLCAGIIFSAHDAFGVLVSGEPSPESKIVGAVEKKGKPPAAGTEKQTNWMKGSLQIRAKGHKPSPSAKEEGGAPKGSELVRPLGRHPGATAPEGTTPVVKTVTGPDMDDGRLRVHGKARSSVSVSPGSSQPRSVQRSGTATVTRSLGGSASGDSD